MRVISPKYIHKRAKTNNFIICLCTGSLRYTNSSEN